MIIDLHLIYDAFNHIYTFLRNVILHDVWRKKCCLTCNFWFLLYPNPVIKYVHKSMLTGFFFGVSIYTIRNHRTSNAISSRVNRNTFVGNIWHSDVVSVLFIIIKQQVPLSMLVHVFTITLMSVSGLYWFMLKI